MCPRPRSPLCKIKSLPLLEKVSEGIGYHASFETQCIQHTGVNGPIKRTNVLQKFNEEGENVLLPVPCR